MSWGTELWDQFDNILAHGQKGIDLCERFSQFTKERCSIEIDYANKLKKLVKSFLPKKKEDDELTTSNGFLAMIKEVNDIAGQHETISESLLSSVVGENQNLIQDLKLERKKAMQEGSKHQSTLQAQFAQLEKVKKASERAFRDMEKAQETYKKAAEDQSLSRNEIDRAKQTLSQRLQGFEQSKHDHAAEVQRTNKVQKEHYQVLMPQVFNHLQSMDERRIAKVKEFLSKTAETERSSIPIINHCIDGIVQAANIVDYKKEMQLVIDKYKTGFPIPSDVPFEDVSSSNYNKSMTNIYGTVSGSMSVKKDKKRPGLLGILGGPKDDAGQKDDFSHLPPIQQKRQLTAKIDSLKICLTKETSERDALLKMHGVYQKNTSLGDPTAVARQLEEKSQKLHQLGQELKKYEEYMMEATRRLAGETGPSTNANDSSHSESPVTGTVQMTSESAASSSNKVKGKPSTPNKPNSSKTPDLTSLTGVGLVEMFPSAGPPNRQKSSTPRQQQQQQQQQQDSFDNASDDEFMDGGTCTAIYDFDGAADGSVAMKTGQEFTIVARDEGDGWTHVTAGDGRRGFVPTTYVRYKD